VKPKKRGAPLTVEYFFERSIPEPNSGCWFWLGALGRGGYGSLGFMGRQLKAHRAMFQIVAGFELPANLMVCHKCDMPSCINPDHLFLGTQAENMRDCSKKGRFPARSGGNTDSNKLTESDILAIRSRSGDSYSALAAEFGVSKGMISHIVSRRKWGHL
jgi:hypothetical protein